MSVKVIKSYPIVLQKNGSSFYIGTESITITESGLFRGNYSLYFPINKILNLK